MAPDGRGSSCGKLEPGGRAMKAASRPLFVLLAGVAWLSCGRTEPVEFTFPSVAADAGGGGSGPGDQREAGRADGGPGGGGGSAGTPDAGSACDALEACCPAVPAAEQAICRSTAAARNDANCAQVLDLAHNFGVCAGQVVPPAADAGPTDSGGTSGSDATVSPGGGSCGALAACCSMVPAPAQGICMSTAQAGNQQSCDQALQVAVNAGLCSGAPDGGAAGGTGDSGLPPRADAGARPDAGAFSAPDAGEVSGPDAGPSSGQVCLRLFGCCLAIPAQLSAACLQVAASRNDAQCGQVAGLLAQFGLCE